MKELEDKLKLYREAVAFLVIALIVVIVYWIWLLATYERPIVAKCDCEHSIITQNKWTE